MFNRLSFRAKSRNLSPFFPLLFSIIRDVSTPLDMTKKLSIALLIAFASIHAGIAQESPAPTPLPTPEESPFVSPTPEQSPSTSPTPQSTPSPSAAPQRSVRISFLPPPLAGTISLGI